MTKSFLERSAIENLRHHIPLKGKIRPYGAEFDEHAYYVDWSSLFLLTLCCAVVRPILGHFKMDGHEKNRYVKQGLNLPVSRFNFLLFLSRCLDTV